MFATVRVTFGSRRLAETQVRTWEAMERWMVDAACRGVSLAVFFPLRGQSAEAARSICSSCPVLSACSAFALSDDAPPDGVIAGMAPRQRLRLRAELRREL